MVHKPFSRVGLDASSPRGGPSLGLPSSGGVLAERTVRCIGPGPTLSALVPFAVTSGGGGSTAGSSPAGVSCDRLDDTDKPPQAEDDLRGLHLGEEWAQSFAAFDKQLKRNAANPPAASDSRDAEEFASSLTTDELQDLLELSDCGIAVNWPSGLDERVANIILLQRRSTASASTQCDRAAPA